MRRSGSGRRDSEGPGTKHTCPSPFCPRHCDLVDEGAKLEFVVAEEVCIVGGNQRTGEVVDLRVDGLTDGLSESLRFGALFR